MLSFEKQETKGRAEMLALFDAGTFVEGIINRNGDGPCPFEAAVMDIRNPAEALAAIRAKRAAMQKGA